MVDFIEVFPWNENFEVDIEVIDTQHKRLVQLLNLLASHIAYQSDAPTLNTIFNELAEYAVYHFKTEEAIWHNCFEGDNWEHEHQEVHNTFVTAIGNLKAEDGVKPLEVVIEDVLSFLTHWLAFHILDSDKRMSKVALAVREGLSLEEAKKARRARNERGNESLN